MPPRWGIKPFQICAREDCHKVVTPKRRRGGSPKKYCSQRCGEIVRCRRYRATRAEHIRLMAEAHRAVRLALKSGILFRPDVCEDCGKDPQSSFGRLELEAHHYLGYATEHHLDVRWLCRSCHKKAERDANAVSAAKLSS